MRVAVLSLTRDRLAYTQHCFQTLHDLGGCDFDHYVWDNASQDGTQDWLRDTYDPDFLCLAPENAGISKALNGLLDWTREQHYDVIVKFDNDCEVVTEGALKDCAEFVARHPGWLISPRIEGLNNPVPTIKRATFGPVVVLEKQQIGGIFLAAHASVYETFRYDENNPSWGMDDVQISGLHRCGYLDAHVANHYETTAGQAARFPEYWERKTAEAAA